MHRLLVPVLFVFLLLTVPGPCPSAMAKDTWVSVRSKNFLLIGNASEKEIKQVAARLEQFREVFIHLFPRMNFTSPVPTTVVVFNSDRSYRPFKPNPTTAGFFQPGPDVNYITLTTEAHGEQDPFDVIFHEYTHLFVNNNMGNPPTWFNEGLAEYYSTFAITDDQKVELGRPIANHVLLLRQNKLVPLRTLFQVDPKSPYYNEANKQSIFYAQSWALMHYLIIGKEGRLAQLSDFLDKLKANVPMEQAFQQSFQMDFDTMEKELRRYVQQDRYNVMHGHFERKLELDTSMQTAPVSEAEAQAYLGDLLLHTNRKDCEAYLQRALALDPNLGMAHASLGMARFREGKTEEARKSLALAVAANSQNYLTHYYYAYSLSRTSPDDPQMITGYAPETAAKIRDELQKAISLRPDYPESYNLLAFVSLVTGTEMEGAITALKRALQVSPGRNDFYYMLAQLYVRTSDYKTARKLLEQVANSNAEEDTRQHAQTLLKQIDEVEEQKRRFEAARKARGNSSPNLTNSLTESSESATVEPNANDPSSYLREVLRQPAAGETQLQGTLVRIDCEPKGAIVFVVKTAAGVLQLKADAFGKVEITTYSPDVKGDITCGPRNPENSVVVCYLPGVDKRTKADGVLKSIEFVPKDFKLKP
ncbi:MAG TPA: tetratricopeptide repeat protein [Pyrinomonadaceae bacterium]|nr:tetratricopeptide repeat protein [Pyrinomonadaceae bacterium]